MKKIADLRTRTLTGVLFCVLLIAAIWGGQYTFLLLALLVVAFNHFEFFKMVSVEDIKPQTINGIITGIGIIALTFLSNTLELPVWLYYLPVAMIVWMFIYEMFRNKSQPFANISHTILGVIFSAIGFTFLIKTAYLNNIYNFHYPLAFFILLWVNDSGAYLVGVSVGRRKLFERISPKKSWEGFIGGVVLAMLAGYVLSLFFKELTIIQWIVTGAIIGVFGTLGDLSESMLKRSVNVKDSGSVLPGHGGIMDRFDGVVFSAPIVYLYLHFTF